MEDSSKSLFGMTSSTIPGASISTSNHWNLSGCIIILPSSFICLSHPSQNSNSGLEALSFAIMTLVSLHLV